MYRAASVRSPPDTRQPPPACPRAVSYTHLDVYKRQDELRGEKIDIIKWSEDPAQFIAAALAPSDVVDVMMAEEGKACRVRCV